MWLARTFVILLVMSFGCGDAAVTPPDPLPPARVVAIERVGWVEDGIFHWAEEVHVTFDVTTQPVPRGQV